MPMTSEQLNELRYGQRTERSSATEMSMTVMQPHGGMQFRSNTVSRSKVHEVQRNHIQNPLLQQLGLAKRASGERHPERRNAAFQIATYLHCCRDGWASLGVPRCWEILFASLFLRLPCLSSCFAAVEVQLER